MRREVFVSDADKESRELNLRLGEVQRFLSAIMALTPEERRTLLRQAEEAFGISVGGGMPQPIAALPCADRA